MVASILLCCIALGAEPSAEDYPFLAKVIVDQAEVQSGNGRRFYTTDRLAPGTIVEVHRRDPGGWYAIRPPAGSFSWIPAEQVTPTDVPDVAEVTSEEAVSWIGSKSNIVREHRFVVKLKIGERVEILGEKEVTDENGEPQMWYKIAPPVGEFRWIQVRELARLEQQSVEPLENEPIELATEAPSEPAIELADSRPTSPPAQFRPRSKITLSSLQPNKDAALTSLAPSPATSFRESAASEAASGTGTSSMADETLVRPAAFNEVLGDAPKLESVDLNAMERDQKNSSSDGFVPRGSRFTNGNEKGIARGTTASATLPETLSEPPATSPKPDLVGEGLNPRAGSSTVATTTVSATLTRAELDARLAGLDAELTVMVARDPRTWELSRVRAAAEQLIEQSPTAADRGRVRILVEKIHQFATTFNVEDDPRFANAIAPPAAPQKPEALDPKYDGVGWLKPVIARERPAAPYALVDSDGKPLAFVTPAPGMNLNRYLNKPLGVYGRRGYVEALATPHIVVERVIDLGRHIR